MIAQGFSDDQGLKAPVVVDASDAQVSTDNVFSFCYLTSPLKLVWENGTAWQEQADIFLPKEKLISWKGQNIAWQHVFVFQCKLFSSADKQELIVE